MHKNTSKEEHCSHQIALHRSSEQDVNLQCICPECAAEIEDMDALVAAHAEHMTPHHLRTHKGGRAPAADPRDNPAYTPTQARRIMKNRLSAARSKLRRKTAIQVCEPDSQTNQLTWVSRCDVG